MQNLSPASKQHESTERNLKSLTTTVENHSPASSFLDPLSSDWRKAISDAGLPYGGSLLPVPETVWKEGELNRHGKW